MKNQLFLLVIISSVIFSACSGGASKDSATKKRVEKVGKLQANKADVNKYYYLINDIELKEAKVPYGVTMEIRVKGFDGFKEIEGKINANISIKVTGKDSVAILDNTDMFGENYPDGVPVELFQTNFYLSVKFQPPFKINETYKVVAIVADKNSDAKITITEDFLLVPSKGLTYKEEGLTSNGVFMFKNQIDYNKPYLDDKVSVGDTLRAVFTGLSGFEQKDSTVFIAASIKLCNEFGDVLSETKNVFEEIEKTGMNVEEAKDVYKLFYIIPEYLKPKTKYNFIYTFYDLKGKATLTAKYDFTVK